MAFQHQHSHGRVFNGIYPRDADAEDNKTRFIIKGPGKAATDKTHVIGDDGKKHTVHKNGGLVHVHDFAVSQKNEVDGADGKKHVVNVNKDLGLVHNLGLSNKQEVDGADGKKHVIQKNGGLIHDLGLSDKQVVDGADGKKHVIHKNGGLVHVHDLGVADKAANVETVYSQVYVTESKTFAGPATYVTVTGTSPTTTASLNSAEAAYQSAKSAANAPEQGNASSGPATSASAGPSTRTSATSYKTTPPQLTRSGATHIKGSPQTTSRSSPSQVVGTPLSQAGSNNGVTSSKSNGSSAGTSAGIAIGVLAALAICGGLLYFCIRRRRNQKKDREGAEKLDEKHVSKNSFFGGTAAAIGAPAGNIRRSVQSDKSFTSHSAATAPRLSLRPVTQFLPNIMGGGSSNTEAARGGPQMSEKSKSGWDRTPAGANSNPFDDAAVLDEKNARPVSPLNPFEEGDGVAGKKSPSHSSKNSWEGSEPPTPKSTKFGTAAAVPIAGGATGGPKGTATGPNNVHRVQLDFKPSMDDELELRSGQIVRMLHEYDDGWVS